MFNIKDRLRTFFENLMPKKGGTVRFMFPVVLGFAVILGAQAISSQSSYIRLEADTTTIRAGDRFSLEVYAYAHVAVNAIDISLTFNPNNVEVIGVDKGQSVLTIWTEEPKIESDKVILRGGTFRRGFIGEHKIATINLLAKNTGQTTFGTGDVMLLAGDGRGTPVSVSEIKDSKLSLYVYDESENPDDIAVDIEVNLLTDLDGDGKVSLSDISAFMGAWASKSQNFDFNGDGRMTFRDFSIILASFFLQ
jgi:hypothetical protein